MPDIITSSSELLKRKFCLVIYRRRQDDFQEKSYDQWLAEKENPKKRTAKHKEKTANAVVCHSFFENANLDMYELGLLPGS